MKKKIGTCLLINAVVVILLHGFFVNIVSSALGLRAGFVDNIILYSTFFGVVLIVEHETKRNFPKEILTFFVTVFKEG